MKLSSLSRSLTWAVAVPMVVLLGACSSVSGPSPDSLSRLPVVTYGQVAPAGQDFVMRYPAGVDLPVAVKVGGSLFEKSDEATLKVRLRRDVYVYGAHLSWDGKQWFRHQDHVTGKLWMTLPGEQSQRRDATSPGELGAEFNLNKP